MNTKHFLIVSLLVLAGLVGGCHYGSSDGHRGYGNGYSSSGSYRDGFRDGRSYEKNREDWNDRYSSGYWRRR